MASTSRAHLRSSTAIVAARTPQPLRRSWRGQAVASAVLALAGAGLMALPSHALAQAQDINLSIAGDTFDIGTSGDETIGSLQGVAGTSVTLGSYNLTTDTSLTTTFAGVISGTGSFIKNGTGTLILTGENTYTGDTVVNGGKLTIGALGTVGWVAGNIVNDAEVAFNRSDDVTYSGAISGIGKLVHHGYGTLTLDGASSYSGLTSIFFNKLAVGANGSLSPNSEFYLVNARATLDISGASSDQSIKGLRGSSGSTVLLGSNSLSVVATYATTFLGVISGSGGIDKYGHHRFHLGGDNTYTGTTTIHEGYLQLGIGRETGSVAGNIVNNGHLQISRSNEFLYGGVISGTGSVWNTSNGTLILTGNNTYTGETRVQYGAVAIGAGGSISNTSLVQLSNTGTKFDISASGANQTIGGLTGGANSEVILGSRRLTINQSGNHEFSGAISGTGGISKSGSGTLTLRGNNTFTGTVLLRGGTLVISGDGSLNGNSIDVGGVSALDISGAASQTIGMLTGSATGRVVLGTSNLTVTGADQSTGYFLGTVSGTGTLIKAGTGVLAFSATDAVSGPIEIAGGGVSIINGGTLTSSSSILLSGTGTRFDISAANNNQSIGGLSGVAGSEITLGSNSLAVNQTANAIFAGVIGGTAGVIKDGSNTLTLTGMNTYTGPTTISGGTLALSGDGALSNGANLSLTSFSSVFDMSAADRFSTLGTISGISGSRILIGDRSLYFGGVGDETFAGSFEGTANSELIKTETGTATLSGNSSGFEGTIKVLDGHLILTGQMGGTYGGIGDTVRQDWTPSMTVSGPAANWSLRDNLYVRKGGSTALTIADGARVSNQFGAIAYDRETELATVTVTGGGSTWTNRAALSVGNNGGNGTVRILNGGTVNSVDGYIGQGSGNGTASQGLVELSGVGSSWINTDRLRVGDVGGQGTLRIMDGASVTTNSALVGSMSGSVGTAVVDGANSVWTINGTLDIGSGFGGSGSTTIASGAVVTVGGGTGTANLASGFGTTGTLNIGAASDVATDAVVAGVLQARRLQFGSIGSSTLRFNHTGTDYEFGALLASGTSGQIKQVSGTTILTADNAGFLGTTSVSGGTLIARGKLGGTATITNGALQFGDASGGAQSSLNSITVSGADSRLSIYGTATLAVTNALNLRDDTVLSIQAGSTSPALTVGSMGIGNNATFNLSGIGSEAQLPLTLINTIGGITGDFAKVTVGGFAGPVDYMSVNTGKSSSGLSYVANYGLSWTAANNLAHGTFTLTDATNSFSLGTALSDQAANIATGWDGTHLTKAGAGTLILSADQAYTGGTNISGGTLQLGEGGTTGSVLGAIVNDGVLAINRSDAVTLANMLSGSGQLEQRGTGTLTVTGNNTYAGGTRVLGGTLSVSDNANLGAASGGVELNGGVLQITGTTFGTLDRNVALGANGGTFDVADADNTLTVSSDLTGGGDLTKRGVGALTLAGNAALGGVRVEAGTLNAALPSISGNIVLTGANSLLNLTDTGSTYSGVISGNGVLSLDSRGITTLTGDNSAFLGLTRLHGGTLIVGKPQAAARLGGSLDVASGATLGGSGTLGSGAGSVVTIGSGATLSPGNSIGTLIIDGDLVLSSGSFLNVELGTAGSALGNASTNDRVDVTGNLTLDGTLNLSQSAASSDGAAGFGYYRIATYGGSLINNGLDIGTTPTLDGADFQILTASEGAVDLFIAAVGDQTLQHWQGGNGVWNGTNAQWLNRDGQVAATWGGNHAVFRNPQGGTITVEGNQSFEGLQFVDDGFSLVGTGSLVTDADGSEIRVLANSASIATAITGTGGITKTQAGTLILSGHNTYAGGTTIAGGTVSVSRDENLGAASGGVTLNGGTLQVTGTDFGTLSRGITIGANGGAIDVADAAHTLTVTSAINGGNLIKRGEGTLALAGTNTLGQISIERGILSGSLANVGTNVSLSDGATLQLNQSGEFAYNGTFNGQGDIVINGDGTTLLAADSSAFTGTTNLNGGTLLIGNEQSAGRLGGSLKVASGATLGGSGILGSGTGSLVTIGAGATLSPGNSIGTLMINGDLKFEDGARYVVEVNPLGTDSDKVTVTGTATLNGGTVAHIGATGNYNPRSTYTILDAGTLTGAFGSVTSDFAFLNPKLIYDYAAGTVDLELVRNDREFASTAQTRNQIATANAIESIGFAAGHAVYDAIVQLADDPAEIRRSFDQLSGELHGSVRSTLLEDSRFVRNAANDRLRAAFGQSAGDQSPVLAYAANGDQVEVDATYEGAAFWAQAYGSWGSFEADAATIELDRQIGGAIIGGDVSLNNWRVGAIAGYSQSELRTEGLKAVADSRTLGIYAGSQWGKVSLRLALAQSWHDIDTHRSVQMTGLSDYVEGEYSATTRQAFIEAGYALISRERNHLEAFANLAQVRARTDGFGETGGAAALDIAIAEADVTFTTLGLRGSRQIALGETAGVLRGSAGWRNASGDTSSEGLHAFSAGDAFSVAGAPIAKDAAVIETGVDVRFNARTTFGLTYTGQFSDSAQDHGFSARLSISF